MAFEAEEGNPYPYNLFTDKEAVFEEQSQRIEAELEGIQQDLTPRI